MPYGTHHLTKEQLERIPELHQAGHDTKKIAALLNCTLQQVRYGLKRHGLACSGGRGGLCYSHADEIRQWANEGVSLSEMARRIGTDHHKIASFLRRHQIPRTVLRQVGENNPAWKGGQTIDKSGYVLIYKPDHPEANRHGYVREHRLVMEQVLGRPLNRTEVVHHRDDNRQNNDPLNLELFDSNGAHLKATLTGKVPNWTQEGMQKIQAHIGQLAKRRSLSNRKTSKPGDPPSQ